MTEQRFHVGPDITVARTLDKAFYLDDAVWRAAREKIFATAWHWLGPLADVTEPGTPERGTHHFHRLVGACLEP